MSMPQTSDIQIVPMTRDALPEPIRDHAELVALIRHGLNSSAKPIGRLLLEAGLISSDQLNEILAEHFANGKQPRLGGLMVRHKLISSDELQRALAQKLGMPYVALREFVVEPHALSLVPVEFAREHNLIPLLTVDDKLVVAVEDPTDTETTHMLHFVTGRTLELVLATREDIEYAISRFYGPYDDKDLQADLAIIKEDTAEVSAEEGVKLGQQRPTVRLVHYMIMDAINSRASDIHLRPREKAVDLYFRIDGSLVPIRSFDISLLASVISRIKILGGMDIAEHRLPQDGRARMSNRGHAIDLRVSVIPTIHGESAVIRILDTSAGLKRISEIGFSDQDQMRFADLLNRNNGLILVTGPTGSGKSTTLYAALQNVRERPVNIITVEDPVEYHMDGIVQIQVNHTTGYSFSRALRHILRHDPDVIMVGEVRDLETAKMAVESSLTGHLVLSTLHTNSAATTVTRLLEMGIEPYLVNTALLAVLAQRLVRCNCPYCLAEEETTPTLRQALGIKADEVFYRGRGCEHCHHTGYQGRRAVYELLTVGPRLRQLIQTGVDAEVIEAEAIAEGMLPLTDQALALARQKLTSLEEVYRVRL